MKNKLTAEERTNRIHELRSVIPHCTTRKQAEAIQAEIEELESSDTVTDEDIDFILSKLDDGFSKSDMRRIAYIAYVLNRANKLSGAFNSWSSGGGFYHIAMQLINNRWVVFHNVEGDITVSEPFITSDDIYNAFWDNCGKDVTYKQPRKGTNLKAYKSAADSILEEDYLVLEFNG